MPRRALGLFPPTNHGERITRSYGRNAPEGVRAVPTKMDRLCRPEKLSGRNAPEGVRAVPTIRRHPQSHGRLLVVMPRRRVGNMQNYTPFFGICISL
jgi:hypothetical protein